MIISTSHPNSTIYPQIYFHYQRILNLCNTRLNVTFILPCLKNRFRLNPAHFAINVLSKGVLPAYHCSLIPATFFHESEMEEVTSAHMTHTRDRTKGSSIHTHTHIFPICTQHMHIILSLSFNSL